MKCAECGHEIFVVGDGYAGHTDDDAMHIRNLRTDVPLRFQCTCTNPTTVKLINSPVLS